MPLNALLCDTNRSSLYIYKYLLSLGFKVTVVGNDRDQPLSRLCESYIQLDYSNIESLAEIINRSNYEAIIPGCTDTSYLSCIQASSTSLKGFDSLSNTQILNTKSQLREVCLKLSIPQPKHLSRDEALGVNSLLIKPVDSFSGLGITELTCPSESELDAASSYASSLSPTSRILYEEKIQGQLYSYSTFLQHRQPANEYIVREDCTVYPYAVDTSCTDTTIAPELRLKMHSAVSALASHLELSDGLIHTQFIVKDNIPYLIEVTRRHPGDLYGHLIYCSTGDHYSAMYADQFLPPNLVAAQSPRTSHFPRYIIRHTICSTTPFNLENISFSLPLKIIGFYPLASLGTTISSAPRGRAAIVFIESDSLDEHERLYKTITSKKLYSLGSM